MHLLPLILYALAAAAYIVHFAKRDERVGRFATATLGAGVLAHTFLSGMQTVEAGHAPLVGTGAAISAFVWLLGRCRLVRTRSRCPESTRTGSPAPAGPAP